VLFAMVSLTILSLASPVSAQLTSSRTAAFLPFISAPRDSLLAREIFDRFLGAIRPSATVHRLTEEETVRSLRDRAISDVVNSPTDIARFAYDGGHAFVVAGLVERPSRGGLNLAALVYVQDDQSFRISETRWFSDEATARAGTPDLARTISHPRNFTPSDTAFFYSLIAPGAGQFSLGRWKHGLFFSGMAATSLVYMVTTPEPDRFEVSPEDFRRQYDWRDQSYHYFAFGREVTYAEYDAMFREAQVHSTRAREERRRAKVRRNRGTALLIGTWLVNIVDTLLLSQNEANTGPFFSLVQSIREGPSGKPSPSIGIRMGWRISPW
jgi:hypothetical protein